MELVNKWSVLFGFVTHFPPMQLLTDKCYAKPNLKYVRRDLIGHIGEEANIGVPEEMPEVGEIISFSAPPSSMTLGGFLQGHVEEIKMRATAVN